LIWQAKEINGPCRSPQNQKLQAILQRLPVWLGGLSAECRGSAVEVRDFTVTQLHRPDRGKAAFCAKVTQDGRILDVFADNEAVLAIV
jgi:hypothetical protein